MPPPWNAISRLADIKAVKFHKGAIYMGKKPKIKMTTADRAKQFMPFSALKGLEEALKEKEKEKSEQMKNSTPK